MCKMPRLIPRGGKDRIIYTMIFYIYYYSVNIYISQLDFKLCKALDYISAITVSWMLHTISDRNAQSIFCECINNDFGHMII